MVTDKLTKIVQSADRTKQTGQWSVDTFHMRLPLAEFWSLVTSCLLSQSCTHLSIVCAQVNTASHALEGGLEMSSRQLIARKPGETDWDTASLQAAP